MIREGNDVVLWYTVWNLFIRTKGLSIQQLGTKTFYYLTTIRAGNGVSSVVPFLIGVIILWLVGF